MARLTGFASVAAATRDGARVRDGRHGASRERSVAELDVGDVTHAPHGRFDFGGRRRRDEANREVRVESFRLDVLERRFGGDHFTQLACSACTMMNARTPRSGVSGFNRTRTTVPGPAGLTAPADGAAGTGAGILHVALRPPASAAPSACSVATRSAATTSPSRPATAASTACSSTSAERKSTSMIVAVEREIVAAHAIEHRLELVRQLGDDGVSHRRAHAFDRVDRAKNLTDGSRRARRRRVALELEQRVIDGGDVLAALGEKELGVLEVVHSGVAGAVLSPSTR